MYGSILCAAGQIWCGVIGDEDLDVDSDTVNETGSDDADALIGL